MSSGYEGINTLIQSKTKVTWDRPCEVLLAGRLAQENLGFYGYVAD